jgi:hypothetical protein
MKSVFGHNFLITSSPAYINNFQTVTDIVVILFRLSKDRFRLFKSKINLRRKIGLNNKDESLSGSDHNRISSGWFFYGTCMVFMMLQAVICVIWTQFFNNFKSRIYK